MPPLQREQRCRFQDLRILSEQPPGVMVHRLVLAFAVMTCVLILYRGECGSVVTGIGKILARRDCDKDPDCKWKRGYGAVYMTQTGDRSIEATSKEMLLNGKGDQSGLSSGDDQDLAAQLAIRRLSKCDLSKVAWRFQPGTIIGTPFRVGADLDDRDGDDESSVSKEYCE